MTNKGFAETDDRFRTLCGVVGLRPTSRQASKYLRGFGRACADGPALARSRFHAGIAEAMTTAVSVIPQAIARMVEWPLTEETAKAA